MHRSTSFLPKRPWLYHESVSRGITCLIPAITCQPQVDTLSHQCGSLQGRSSPFFISWGMLCCKKIQDTDHPLDFASDEDIKLGINMASSIFQGGSNFTSSPLCVNLLHWSLFISGKLSLYRALKDGMYGHHCHHCTLPHSALNWPGICTCEKGLILGHLWDSGKLCLNLAFWCNDTLEYTHKQLSPFMIDIIILKDWLQHSLRISWMVYFCFSHSQSGELHVFLCF